MKRLYIDLISSLHDYGGPLVFDWAIDDQEIKQNHATGKKWLHQIYIWWFGIMLFYSIQESNTRITIFREKLRFIFRGVCGRIWCWFRNLCTVVNSWGSFWLRISYRFFTQLYKMERINGRDIKYDKGTEIIA